MEEKNRHSSEEEIELDSLSTKNQEGSSQDSSHSKTSPNQESVELQESTDYITAKDVGLISLFGILLPSSDQGTDYYTAANLINNEHICRTQTSCPPYSEEQMQEDETRVRRYGYAMLVPILLMTIFSLRQWWRLEKKIYRWLTFPLVILQLYPQYRAIRILCLGMMKKSSWRKEKDLFDQDLSSLEPFIESVPQIHILICLVVSNNGRSNNGRSGMGADYDEIFWLTLALSILSGGFGITKFLKAGPSKIMLSSSGFLDGFASLGLPAVLLSILATLLGKGFLLPVVAAPRGPGRLSFLMVLLWIGFNLLPQFLYASIILISTLGFKRACVIFLNYPALLLTPCFGTWTFGPVNGDNGSCSKCCTSCKSNILYVSYLHTWVNYAISLTCSITTLFIWMKDDYFYTFERLLKQMIKMLRDKRFFDRPSWIDSSVFMSWILLIIILPLSITFVQTIDNCCSCLCKCCPTQCFPVIERTELQVDEEGNPIAEVDMENTKENSPV